MIQVTIDWANTRIDMSGHADAGPYGQDVLCAAASMALQMLARSCQVLNVKARVKLKSGRGMVQIMDDSPRIKERFYHTVDGLLMLEEAHPEHIKIEAK